MRTFAIAAVVSLSCAALLPTDAYAIKIEPGKWEFTSTTQMPMMPEPQMRRNEECVTDGERTPDEFIEDMDGCDVTDVKSDDSTMAWTVKCSEDARQMTGSANITSTGATLQGTMSMEMSMPGHPAMKMDMKWQGKRLGPCD